MQLGSVDGRAVLFSDGRALDVATASGEALPADPVALLERWDDLVAWALDADWSASYAVTAERLGAPVPTPRQTPSPR